MQNQHYLNYYYYNIIIIIIIVKIFLRGKQLGICYPYSSERPKWAIFSAYLEQS